MRRASSVYALRILAAGAAFALAAPPALAEDDDERASGVVEEIVVSATYRDTRLMDTPLTISAVTDHDIVNKGIEDIQTLYQSIPGLAYRSNSQTYNTLSVRGITPPAGGTGATVGVYFDNMPITDATTGGLAQTLGPLFDLERVEVLKGPQGTLYGEGRHGRLDPLHHQEARPERLRLRDTGQHRGHRRVRRPVLPDRRHVERPARRPPRRPGRRLPARPQRRHRPSGPAQRGRRRHLPGGRHAAHGGLVSHGHP